MKTTGRGMLSLGLIVLALPGLPGASAAYRDAGCHGQAARGEKY
jgi:hypothetical protein